MNSANSVIMTKSKIGMITSDMTYLVTHTFPAIVIDSTFLLISVGRYLLPLATQNRCTHPNIVIKISFSYFIWKYIYC